MHLTPVNRTLASQAQFFHDAFAHWLDHPGVTIACGRRDFKAEGLDGLHRFEEQIFGSRRRGQVK